MPRIHYPSMQGALLAALNKHFPPFLYNRFEVKMDIDIFKPTEDEGIWNRKKADTQHAHILFDGLEILEIPPHTPREWVEPFILRAFRDAIADGRIFIDKVLEWTDNETAKRNKKDIEKKKKDKLAEAFQFAKQNKFDIERITAKLPAAGKGKRAKNVRKLSLKGGE